MGEHSDFKFGVQVYHSNSQAMDNKLFLKGAQLCHVTNVKFLVPLKFLERPK